jgi:hypothetical protein
VVREGRPWRHVSHGYRGRLVVALEVTRDADAASDDKAGNAADTLAALAGQTIGILRKAWLGQAVAAREHILGLALDADVIHALIACGQIQRTRLRKKKGKEGRKEGRSQGEKEKKREQCQK